LLGAGPHGPHPANPATAGLVPEERFFFVEWKARYRCCATAAVMGHSRRPCSTKASREEISNCCWKWRDVSGLWKPLMSSTNCTPTRCKKARRSNTKPRLRSTTLTLANKKSPKTSRPRLMLTVVSLEHNPTTRQIFTRQNNDASRRTRKLLFGTAKRSPSVIESLLRDSAKRESPKSPPETSAPNSKSQPKFGNSRDYPLRKKPLICGIFSRAWPNDEWKLD